MKKSNRKLLAVIILLIAAMSFYGCGGDKGETKSNAGNENTTGAAVETATATEHAISTGEAVSEDTSRVSEEDEAKEDKTKKSDTDKKSPKPSKKDKKDNKKNKDNNKDREKPNTAQNDSSKIKCTISIDCKNYYAKYPDPAAKLSDKGVILAEKTVTLDKGASVYDALKATGVAFVGSSYIQTINGLSEKDGGKLSGWMYLLNGTVSPKSCKGQKLGNGDVIAWRYTCNSGGDI